MQWNRQLGQLSGLVEVWKSFDYLVQEAFDIFVLMVHDIKINHCKFDVFVLVVHDIQINHFL